MTEKQDSHPRFRLVLYIAGESTTSEVAIANLKKIENSLEGPVEIQVIDIEESPEIAIENGISISPTLVRTHPKPPQRLIGDLSEIEEVVGFLERNIDGE